jgi:putative PIN family toxin of toxin-antitoxin system
LKIVVDTNVLVSALLRPGSLPSRVIDLVFARQVTLVIDQRIFGEYQEVLSRPEFAFPPRQVRAVLEFLWRYSERVQATPLLTELPDPDDTMFIEVVVSALADALVTGNKRHFPPDRRHGVRVLSPREWLEVWAGTHEA